MTTRIGFIGLGAMGKGMAKNLVTKGFDLTVHDIRTEPVKELEQLGAKSAPNARELSVKCDLVFTMVRDDAQTESVILGKDGILEGARKGLTIIVSSTVSPSLCKRLAAEAGKKGVALFDCPVSGAQAGADAGTLTMLLGGPQTLSERFEPVLSAMGTHIFYLGSVGLGEVAKTANNLVNISNIVANTEALAYAVKAGIPLETTLSVIKASTGNSWVAENWDKIMRAKQARGSDSFIHKDMNLALQYAKEIGVDLPFMTYLSKMDPWRLPE